MDNLWIIATYYASTERVGVYVHRGWAAWKVACELVLESRPVVVRSPRQGSMVLSFPEGE